MYIRFCCFLILISLGVCLVPAQAADDSGKGSTDGGISVSSDEVQKTALKQIQSVQRQIANIVEINQHLKLRQSQQVKELQTIIDQAKIHDRILKDLRNAEKKSSDIESGTPEEFVRREKLRIIQEETLKNQDRLASLGRS